MKVSELIEQLSKYPGDMIVLRARDDEWNSIYQVNAVEDSLTEDPTGYTVELVNEDDVEAGEYWNYSTKSPMTTEDFVKVLVIT